MPVATHADALEFTLGDAVFGSLAVPSRGCSQFAIWALELAPGCPVTLTAWIARRSW